MADSNHLSARTSELTDDDPFAELTRIMGQGAVVRPLPVDEGVDTLALDLEKELLGDFTDFQGGSSGFAEEGQPDFQAADTFSDDDFASELFKGTDLDEFDKALAADPVFEDQPLEASELDFSPSVSDSDSQEADFAQFADRQYHADGFEQDHFSNEGVPIEAEPVVNSRLFGEPEDVSASFDNFEPAFDLTGATFTLRGMPEPAQESYSEAEFAPDPSGMAGGDDPFASHEVEDFDVASASYALDQQQPYDVAQSSAEPEIDLAGTSPVDPFASSDQRIEDELERALNLSPDWNDHQEAASASQQSYQTETGQEDWSYDGPPEIDTVEIPEKAVALTESLDLPHVPYREEVKSAVQVDEIEELLSGAFGGLNHKPAQNEVWDEHQQDQGDQQHADFDALFEADLATANAATLAHSTYAASSPQFDGGWNDAHGYDESSVHQTQPMPGTPPPVRTSGGFRNRPVIAIAALLAGVAILGVAGVYAYNQFGSGSSNEVALIKADGSPVKVKPENPGGTTIPNQDSQVYRQVAGETPAPTPTEAQPQLVTTSEEPVQLPQEPETADLLIGQEVGSSEDEVADLVAAEATIANDERLVNSDTEDSAMESQTMLTPRLVRSLIVRPDGTMVEREVVPPAEAASQPSASATAAASETLPGVENDRVALALPGDATPATVNSGDAEDSVEIPNSAPIPSARPNNVPPPAAPAPAAPVAAAPASSAPAQVAAVQPAPAASAAESDWSVQIASQPSLEAAQQSYQSLAQRYGTMLQGKGVNIVKAEVQGKGTYYRVRIPAASKSDAISLCEALKAQGGSCFVSQ